MAKVFKRKERWGIDYTYREKRIRIMVAPNKALAEIILKKTLVKIAENKHLDIKREKRIKFSQFCDTYIERHLKRNLKDTWEKSEKHNVKHLRKFFSGKYLHEITERDIHTFIDFRRGVVSDSSVNKNIVCLKAMYNRAIDWGIYLGDNPVKNIKKLKVENKRTRYLEKEEIARLLRVTDGSYIRDIIEFAINTGMRKSEILNLKWREVDMKRCIITLLRTKNGEIRYVPINNDLKALLIRVRKNPESQYVFCNRFGKNYKDVRRVFSNALKHAGIKDFRFHDLRHTLASHLVMAGVDLMTVKEILGHKSLQMTERYSHLSHRHKKNAVERLNFNNSNKKEENSEICLECKI